MTGHENVLSTFDEAGITAGIRWASSTANGRALQDFDAATGHNQTVLGVMAHVLHIDRLDRVFRTGRFETADPVTDESDIDILIDGLGDQALRTMPQILAGTVRREDLNQSPGWKFQNYHLFLCSFPFGEIDQILWRRKSATKQKIAASMAALNPDQLVLPGSVDEQLDLGDQYLTIAEVLAANPELSMERLVLCHSVEQSLGEFELFLGQPRLNTMGGSPWVWRVPLLPPGGDDGASISGMPSPSPTLPRPSDVSDAPVRLRREIGGTGAVQGNKG